MTHIAPDYGPAAVLNRGERYKTEIPDIDRPNIRDRSVKAARVRCIYADLWAEGRLSHGQREAADRVALQWEATQSHGATTGGAGGGATAAVSRCPAERRLQAAGDLREAQRLLGFRDMAWLVLVVVFNRWAEAGEDEGRLCRLLQALAEMWGMD